VPARTEADVNGKRRFHVAMWSDPSSLAARCRSGADELAQPLQHPPMPEDGIAAQVTAIPYQSVGISHVLESQEV
jgi:hypothetical protein